MLAFGRFCNETTRTTVRTRCCQPLIRAAPQSLAISDRASLGCCVRGRAHVTPGHEKKGLSKKQTFNHQTNGFGLAGIERRSRLHCHNIVCVLDDESRRTRANDCEPCRRLAPHNVGGHVVAVAVVVVIIINDKVETSQSKA